MTGCAAPRSLRRPLVTAFATTLLLAMPYAAGAFHGEPTQAIATPAPLSAAQQVATLAAIDDSIAAGRLAAANAMIGRALPSDPSPELLLRLAEIALISGDLAGAAGQFTELSSQPDIAARANQGLGIVRLRQGNLAAATVAIDAALAGDPGLARAWNARGIIADQRRDWAGADAAYSQALAHDPQSVQALTNRGYSRLLQGRYPEAEADLVAALARDPQSTTTQANLRFARAMQGRYREAFAGSTRETLANDLNTVGFAAMVRGDRDSAETYFNRALALNTRFDHVAWANLEYMQLNGREPMDGSDAGLAAADAAIHHPAKRARR